MSPKNKFLDDPNADPKTQTAANIEVINAMSAVILAHGTHYEEMFEKFKKMFDDSHLKFWIILAGLGGGAAIVAMVIEAVRAGLDIYLHYHPS